MLAATSKEAQSGDAIAQNNLGGLYAKGYGATQDYKKAVHWYKKAAMQGYSLGQVNLAQSYLFGMGVKQDIQKATSLYQQAVEQGNIQAIHACVILQCE